MIHENPGSAARPGAATDAAILSAGSAAAIATAISAAAFAVMLAGVGTPLADGVFDPGLHPLQDRRPDHRRTRVR